MVYCWKCGTELREEAAFCSKCGTPIKPMATATSEGRTGFELLTSEKTAQDHWVKRLLAFIIDSVIVGGVVWAIVAVLVFTAVLPSVVLGNGAFTVWWGFWFAGVIPLLILAYFIVSELVYAKTLGKHIMGLKVARKDGKHMDFAASFLRNISKIFFIFLILDVAAGLGVRGELSQKFSDRYAGTVVENTGQLKIIS